MRTQQEIDDIIKEVQDALNSKKRSGGISLKVPAQGYVVDDPYLSIIVQPDDSNIRAYDYVQMLSQLEKELKTHGRKDVILVPALPD